LRLTRAVSISVALLALLAPIAGARPAATSEGDFVTVEFSGSVTAHFDQKVEYTAGKKDTITSDLFYSWRESTVVPITHVTTPVIGEAKDLVTGSGTLKATSTANPAANCTGQLHELAQASGRFATSDSGVRVGTVQGVGTPGVDGVEVTGTMPIDYYEVTNNCHGYVEHSMQSGPDPPLSCTVSPNKSCGKGYQKSGSLPISDGSYTYTVIASFQVVRSTKAEPQTPQKDEAKEAAAQDFSNIVFGRTWAFCYPRMIRYYPEGVPFGSGGPQVVTFQGAPWVDEICGDLVRRMSNDFDSWQDPPRADYLALATAVQPRAALVQPQWCARLKAGDRAACVRLNDAGEKELAAVQQVTAVSAAIKTTVARESGAQKARDSSAVALQERQLAKLATQFARTRAADAKAAGTLADQLRALRVTGPIPPALYRQGLAVVMKRLAGVGIGQAEIAKIIPGKPVVPSDVSVALGGFPSSGTVTTTPPPPSASATIASVTFSGRSANPSFVVHGRNFGTQPKPDPPVHPLGTTGCPVNVPGGDNGYDYGTSLYLAVPAKNWAGGRYRPSLNETDCIDLVVTKFTPTEVDFHFGRSYSSFYPKFSLDDGDAVEVGVNGATKTVHVKYGATVSS
jgi:hypothetical protein